MNILSFDIEEWWVYENYPHYGSLSKSQPRIEKLLDELLGLLDDRGIKATFFCLGYIAQHFPHVIKKIDSQGHEIGCHSDVHQFIGNMKPNEFSQDTKEALDKIQNITGSKVIAYRAPAFSITENTLWALEILAENGIEIDCSIFPASHRFGGFPSFSESQPVIIEYGGYTLKEFPISLTKIFGKPLAFSGGGFFRLMPYFFIRRIMKKKDYVMSYFHLRDFDKGVLNKENLSLTKMSKVDYFKNFYGIKNAEDKFKRFMEDYKFISLMEASSLVDWENASRIKL